MTEFDKQEIEDHYRTLFTNAFVELISKYIEDQEASIESVREMIRGSKNENQSYSLKMIRAEVERNIFNLKQLAEEAKYLKV